MLKPVGLYTVTLLLVGMAATSALAFGPPQSQSVPAGVEEAVVLGAAPSSGRAADAWRAFTATEGAENTAAWNAATGTPHRVQGKGVKIAEAASEANIGSLTDSFVRSHAALLGADPDQLRLLSRERHGARWYADYQQVHAGLDVIGGRVHVRVRQDGIVTTFGSDFYPGISLSPSPGLSEATGLALAKDGTGFREGSDRVLSSRLVVLPRARSGQATYHLAYEVRLRIEMDAQSDREPALWRVYVDANSGDILGKRNEIYFDTIYGAVSGYIKPAYITDPDVEEAFAEHYVNVTGYSQDTTDAAGLYSIEVGTGGNRQVTAMIKGRWASIINNGGAEAAFSDSVPPGSERDIVWGTGNSIASERNAYYHAWVSHAKIKEIDPSFTGMDRQTTIQVNQPNYCNGYWDGSLILLGAGTAYCNDLALFADVIYHEYGHGITDKLYGTLSPSGAMHEAFSDYFACTISGEPYIGEGIGGPGTYFRNCDNALRYPEDLTGEVHDDGRILAGALWDLREALWPDIHLADSLFHYARYGKSANFLDYYYDLLEADDDDGNLANGTPHYYMIAEAFGGHGIGPGLYIDIAHAAVHASEDSLTAFPVVAEIASNLSLDADSLLVCYSTGGGFTALTMLPTGNPDQYSAAIPGQSYGTTVSYYIYAKADGRPDYQTHPEGAPATLHSFTVGADNVSPIIVHEPLVDQPDAGWPATVTASVTDNLGLDSVVLEYFKNGVAQTDVPMTNVPGSDDYQAAFAVTASPGDFIEYRIVATDVPMTNVPGSDDYQAAFAVAASPGDLIEYRIVATDASAAAHVTVEPAADFNVFGIAAAQAFTFETGDQGWTHYAASGWTDQWHVSTQRNHTPGGGQSWKCGDSGAGQYANRLSALLETPWMEIGEGATLVFWYWMEAETYEPLQGSDLAWDGAALSLVDSAGKASPIEPLGGYPHRILPDSDAPFTANKPVYSGQEGWEMAVFDLSGYQGQGKIRFKFGSDGAAGFEGWYIDDVMIWSQGVLAGIGPCDDSCPDTELPLPFALANPAPNPSSGRMTVAYSVGLPGSRVAVRVFDVRGRLARTLVDETKVPGRYSAIWDGRDSSGALVSPGIYFVRMEAADFMAGAKIVVTK